MEAQDFEEDALVQKSFDGVKQNVQEWSDDEEQEHQPVSPTARPSTAGSRNLQLSDNRTILPELNNQTVNEGEDDVDDEEDSQSDRTLDIEGLYDPAEYASLPVSAEIKELFQYITQYNPQTIELEPKLRPFIPDYLPAVGDIDAFLKVVRPDGQPEGLGLTVLDEPSIQQSDPSVLELQLRAISKQSSAKALVVKKLDELSKNGKAIDKWIKDISELHRAKPPPTLTYNKPMPDIDSLIQQWPPEVEDKIQEKGLPPPDLDCDLTEYVDIVCGLLDIPVHKSKIQSLHLLFTLYIEIQKLRQQGRSVMKFEN